MPLGEHVKEVKIKRGEERLDRRSGTGHRHSGTGFPDGPRKGGVHGWGVPGEEEMRPVVEVLDKNDPNYEPNEGAAHQERGVPPVEEARNETGQPPSPVEKQIRKVTLE
ncbi:hypothetical protein KFL_000340360 [Klebsormidium nitens]|uniref:Hyaluronan/mRNA-binding protein domain-containing protein n=1 Tax=Klebsormidium nitens TaxID=105231 RepID=A0A1Y1HNM4_KLENI|nr:hypothetical protein KFL_000340360 [Klebsormidium nitens]|eukprot:GAQ79633.1 hypothetical protein KFL_000340360 [Klebsormidium nitens]